MGKTGLFLTSIMVIVMASFIMPNEAADIGKYLYESAPEKLSQPADAIYAIPPTPSWTTITINNDAAISNNPDTSIVAANYSDTFALLSDGSILLNITTYP